MKIVIVGQGAIGLLYYTMLSKSGFHQVALVPSNRITTFPQNFNFTPYNQPQQNIQLKQADKNDIVNCDLLISCVKSYQVSDALTPLFSLLSSTAKIILCHNGMGVYERLPNGIKHSHPILVMLCTHGSKKNNNLDIIHTGIGHSDIGCINQHLHAFSSQSFLHNINKGLGEIYWHKDIVRTQWIKLAINSVINPITAINNIINGDILLPEYNRIKLSLLHEIVTVAKHEGHDFDAIELSITVNNVATKTALNSSSMRCDVLAGKKTEIEYINGYIHRLGLKHSVPTPENTRFWKKVLSLQSSKYY